MRTSIQWVFKPVYSVIIVSTSKIQYRKIISTRVEYFFDAEVVEQFLNEAVEERYEKMCIAEQVNWKV